MAPTLLFRSAMHGPCSSYPACLGCPAMVNLGQDFAIIPWCGRWQRDATQVGVSERAGPKSWIASSSRYGPRNKVLESTLNFGKPPTCPSPFSVAIKHPPKHLWYAKVVKALPSGPEADPGTPLGWYDGSWRYEYCGSVIGTTAVFGNMQ